MFLQDHCWKYILRNWHLLQRTPTYKETLPHDQRQRLAQAVNNSLSELTTLDSPGDQSQSTGFSVLWDASNTQPDASAANALTPDGKRPVSKATEKRRQRLAQEQEQQRQEEEKRRVQQRRQQTVTEIRQRQAAAAAQTGAAAQATSCVVAASVDSSNAGTSRLAAPVQHTGQASRVGPRADSQNGPQRSQQRARPAGPRAEGQQGPQQGHQRAGLRADSQQSPQQGQQRAGRRAEGQQGSCPRAEGQQGSQARARMRTSSQEAPQELRAPTARQSTDGPGSAQPRPQRQARQLGAGPRAAATQGRRQGIGQHTDQQQKPSSALSGPPHGGSEADRAAAVQTKQQLNSHFLQRGLAYDQLMHSSWNR